MTDTLEFTTAYRDGADPEVFMNVPVPGHIEIDTDILDHTLDHQPLLRPVMERVGDRLIFRCANGTVRYRVLATTRVPLDPLGRTRLHCVLDDE